MQAELAAFEQRVGVAAPPPRAPRRSGCRHAAGRHPRRPAVARSAAGDLDVVLNARRGLAIESFRDARLGGDVLFGTLEHGYFPTIELGADWYSGSTVQESPLRHKGTDLEPVEPVFAALDDGGVRAWGTVDDRLRRGSRRS